MVQPKVKKLTKEQATLFTESQKVQTFMLEYQTLTKKHGYKIIVTPNWKKSLDNNSFSLILQTSVGKIAVEKPVEEKAPAKESSVKKAEAKPEVEAKPEPSPEMKKA